MSTIFMIPRGAPNEDDHVVLSVGGRDYKIYKGVEYVVRENGEWILNRNGSATCKKCLHTTLDAWGIDKWLNFCPNCGADMRKVENG